MQAGQKISLVGEGAARPDFLGQKSQGGFAENLNSGASLWGAQTPHLTLGEAVARPSLRPQHLKAVDPPPCRGGHYFGPVRPRCKKKIFYISAIRDGLPPGRIFLG